MADSGILTAQGGMRSGLGTKKFAIAFPNKVLTALATFGDLHSNSIAVSSVSLTSINISSAAEGSVTCYWFAIGA